MLYELNLVASSSHAGSGIEFSYLTGKAGRPTLDAGNTTVSDALGKLKTAVGAVVEIAQTVVSSIRMPDRV